VVDYNLSQAVWHTSSYSGQNGDCVEVAPLGQGVAWSTSSYSGTNGSCVEVARHSPGAVAVRDSKDRNGPALVFTPAQWQEFASGVKSGRFDAA